MNKRYRAFILFILCAITAHASDTSRFVPSSLAFDYQKSNQIRVTGSYGFQSTFLNKTLLSENNWTDAIKQKQLDQFGNLNRIGLHSNASIYFHGRLVKDKTFTPIIGLFQEQTIGLAFEKPFGEIFLFGNKNVPQIAISKRNGIQNRNEIGAYLGLEKVSQDQIFEFGLRLSTLQNYTNLVMDNGTITLDSAGEIIDFEDFQLKYYQTTTTGFQNLGLAINVNESKILDNGLRLNLGVENLGVLYLANSVQSVARENFQFDGLDLTNTPIEDNSIDVVDTISNNYAETDTANHYLLSPYFVHASVYKPINEKEGLEAEVDYLNFVGYIPQLKASYVRKINERNGSFTVGVRAGGFTNYGLQLGLNLPFSLNNHLIVDVTALESLASSNLPINWYGRVSLKIGL